MISMYLPVFIAYGICFIILCGLVWLELKNDIRIHWFIPKAPEKPSKELTKRRYRR